MFLLRPRRLAPPLSSAVSSSEVSVLIPSPTSTTSKLLATVIFILLIAGCLYYAKVCHRPVPSSNSGRRGDFFHNFPGLRSAFVGQPTAPNHPLSVDAVLRTFSFRSPPMDLHSRNTRTHLTVPPPYGHPYEYPPSYEVSVSDHTGSSYSPISPSSLESAPWERSTASRNVRDPTS